MAGWFDDHSLWPTPKRAPRSELARLFWLRPSLLGRVTPSAHPSALTVAAGSIGLTDPVVRARIGQMAVAQNEKYALLAWIANPRNSYDDFRGIETKVSSDIEHEVLNAVVNRARKVHAIASMATEDDPHRLNWLTRRAFPSEFSSGKPVEILELALNPNIELSRRIKEVTNIHLSYDLYDPETTPLLAMLQAQVDEENGYVVDREVQYAPQPDPYEETREQMIERISVGRVRYLNPRDVDAFSVIAVEMLGSNPQRWENVWALMPNFDGSLMELIEISNAL